MSLSHPQAIVRHPQWLVSNGLDTVGPVATDLLLRGVLHGRVPGNSWVRQVGWQSWRELSKVREVAALKRLLDRTPGSLTSSRLGEGLELIAQACDPGEAWLMVLHVAAQVTSASVGLLHRLRMPLFLPTTSAVFNVPAEALGEVLPFSDPAYELARGGRTLLGEAKGGLGERAVASRLARNGRVRGVAMLPLHVSGTLCGMLELGHRHHPFREADASVFADIASSVEATLARQFSAIRAGR